jgi:hypothetical protein
MVLFESSKSFLCVLNENIFYFHPEYTKEGTELHFMSSKQYRAV